MMTIPFPPNNSFPLCHIVFKGGGQKMAAVMLKVAAKKWLQ